MLISALQSPVLDVRMLIWVSDGTEQKGKKETALLSTTPQVLRVT